MKASINGHQINFLDQGPKEVLPIVFIHAFPLSHAMWQPQIEVLKSQYRVVSYDIRGHGESEVGDGQYLVEMFVDDLIALLDYLAIKRAVLCGLSMGGYIVLRTAERNPERTAGLVLCDTKSQADTNETKLKRAATLKLIKTQGVKTFADGFLKTVFCQETLNTKPELIKKTREIIESNSPVGIGGALVALAARTDTTQALRNIQVPTLILTGEHDTLAPPSTAKFMQEHIPHSQTHIIAHAAHMTNLENPAEFNKHLLVFLNTLRK